MTEKEAVILSVTIKEAVSSPRRPPALFSYRSAICHRPATSGARLEANQPAEAYAYESEPSFLRSSQNSSLYLLLSVPDLAS